jgi:hypothetical protein
MHETTTMGAALACFAPNVGQKRALNVVSVLSSSGELAVWGGETGELIHPNLPHERAPKLVVTYVASEAGRDRIAVASGKDIKVSGYSSGRTRIIPRWRRLAAA